MRRAGDCHGLRIWFFHSTNTFRRKFHCSLLPAAVIHMTGNGVCNEQSRCFLNPVCVNACCRRDRRGAAAEEVPRIGYLYQGDRISDSTRIEAIQLALHELGYIEGQNIAIEYRYAEGKRGRESELAAELVRPKVDLILVAGGGDWVQAAKNATKTIPIVMTGTGGDPVEAGLVESLARPGGNVTGLTNLSQN